MKKQMAAFRSNARLARATWGEFTDVALRNLKELTARHLLSVAAGDLQFLEGRWYVKHASQICAMLRPSSSAIVSRCLFKSEGIRKVNCVSFFIRGRFYHPSLPTFCGIKSLTKPLSKCNAL